MNEIVLTKDNSPTILSEKFGIAYHSIHGALTETNHVFIDAGLKFYHEKGNTNISILEYGFGSGLNVFQAIKYAINHSIVLNMNTLELYPISLDEALLFANELNLTVEDRDLFLRIHQSDWEVKVPIYSNVFLTKRLIDFNEYKHIECFDIVFFDAFAPESQPEFWDKEFLTKVYNSLNDNGIMTTYCAKGSFKRALKEVGFRIESIPGPPGKREMTRACRV
jgi:tRNA U34 5-methylaminomethyl-2-thiouridine-forming methyltransferase MnmC